MLPELEGRDAREVIGWAFERFGERVAVSTAFGPGGVVLLHLAAQVNPGVKAFFLETGFHIPETLQMVERLRERLGVEVALVRPDAAEIAAADAEAPEPLWARDPDRCCALRKVAPTRRFLAGHDAWLAALRRDQGPTRAATPVLEPKEIEGRALVKVNPLVAWTRKDVWRHVFEHALPYNPLHDQGYPSVGCAPCTRPSEDPGDERGGRWAGTGKTECGLHTII